MVLPKNYEHYGVYRQNAESVANRVSSRFARISKNKKALVHFLEFPDKLCFFQSLAAYLNKNPNNNRRLERETEALLIHWLQKTEQQVGD